MQFVNTKPEFGSAGPFIASCKEEIADGHINEFTLKALNSIENKKKKGIIFEDEFFEVTKNVLSQYNDYCEALEEFLYVGEN
jgi:hypothetical protein